MSKNKMPEICELSPTSLSHDGRAVARQEVQGGARVVFIEDALPGQYVRARITKSKKNFAEATCIEVLTQAEGSIAAPCPHAKNCGGCALQSMPAPTQLFWKENMVREAMTRIAKLSPEELQHIQPIIPSPEPWYYRNKMEFAFGADAEGKLVLGLRAKGSHRIHAVPECRLLPQGCMEAVRQVAALCQEARLKPYIEEGLGLLRHLVLRRPHTLKTDGSPQLLVTLITAPASKDTRLKLSRLGQELLQNCQHITGFVLEERRSASLIAQGEHVITKLGETTLSEKLGAVQYSLSHDAFFQINTAAAENMCATLVRMALAHSPQTQEEDGPLCLWDLYCGVGAPGLSLAKALQNTTGKKVQLHGVEITPAAITMAGRNAKAISMDTAKYTAGDAKKTLETWPTPHIILLDPPRTGLAPEVCQQVRSTGAQVLLYVSCNPATLARDVALLSEKYALQELVPLDFFPQTPHVESCAVLVLRS